MELNFVMRPAGRVAGTLIDEQRQPLVGCSVALAGADLPPSSSVMCWAQTDKQGQFALEDVPTTFRFQFEVRKADPKPPWDDSWASAALRFEKPESGDLLAWFGKRDIRLRGFVLRVAGPGVHGRTATPVAGNVGVLDLTVADPAEGLEHSDNLLVTKVGRAHAPERTSTGPKPVIDQGIGSDDASFRRRRFKAFVNEGESVGLLRVSAWPMAE